MRLDHFDRDEWVAYYRERAQEIRSNSETWLNTDAKSIMLRLADSYDQMANELAGVTNVQVETSRQI